MGIHDGSASRRAATAAVTLATAVATVCAVSTVAASAALASTGTSTIASRAAAAPRPAAAVVHQVSRARQDATRHFWTRSRLAAATALPVPQPMRAGSAATQGIPSPVKFDGVPTVGALFFTTGKQAHFCTASVVNSRTANLILTAAHCVYGSAPASNIEFVPEYHHGQRPYGAWPVQRITVAAGWRKSHNINLDFAFLTVSPPAGTTRPIQFVTGGLWLGINRGYAHPIEVIGYNDTQNTPIGCATHSFKYPAKAGQMKFYCNAFWNGTSGGPWIVNYDPHTGAGLVIGVIGGYQQGGDPPWASYSDYFSWPTLHLYLQAQH
jgi:V8-like Glu-specific endopeptidase